MKKTNFIISVLIAMLSITACSKKKKNGTDVQAGESSLTTKAYSYTSQRSHDFWKIGLPIYEENKITEVKRDIGNGAILYTEAKVLNVPNNAKSQNENEKQLDIKLDIKSPLNRFAIFDKDKREYGFNYSVISKKDVTEDERKSFLQDMSDKSIINKNGIQVELDLANHPPLKEGEKEGKDTTNTVIIKAIKENKIFASRLDFYGPKINTLDDFSGDLKELVNHAVESLSFQD